MKKAKRIFGFLLPMLLVLTSTLAGCSKKVETPKTDTSKSVTVSMYLVGTPAKDYDQVIAAVNAKAKKDLNCTVAITWIGMGDFATKYPLVLASGEPIDLIYAANWLSYSMQAAKGAFMPIETLAPKYAPKSYGAQSAVDKKACTVNGHLYALVSPYSDYNYHAMGYILRGDLMKKYGITSINSMDDVGAYLANVVKYDPQLDPTGFDSQANFDSNYEEYALGYFPITGMGNFPLKVKVNPTTHDLTAQVVKYLDDPALPAFYHKMKDWSNAGYWPKNVLSNKDTDMLKEGKSALKLHEASTRASLYILHPEWDLQYFPGHIGYPTSALHDVMAIPASATNPERALMLLEKFKNEISYNRLLTYGVEGKDYTITPQNQLKVTDPSVFAPDSYCSGGIKDPKFVLPLIGSPANFQQVNDALKATKFTNPLFSFSFNTEPVKSQVAAIVAVMSQYQFPLALGYVSDPAAALNNLKQQLQIAGIDQVQVELQKQVDAYSK